MGSSVRRYGVRLVGGARECVATCYIQKIRKKEREAQGAKARSDNAGAGEEETKGKTTVLWGRLEPAQENQAEAAQTETGGCKEVAATAEVKKEKGLLF